MGDGTRDRAFSQEMREVREKLLAMSVQVEVMIEGAMDALVRRDRRLARDTIALDGKVNQTELEIDELCLLILAKRQPLATDLRFVAFSLKMVTDLERIGDLAVNICERVPDLAQEPELGRHEGLLQLATLVQQMIKKAINAFVCTDEVAAMAVLACDADVDELYRRVFQSLLTEMVSDPTKVRRGVHLQAVAKWLERMGDHAANLAETAVFVMKGKDVRHTIHASIRPRGNGE